MEETCFALLLANPTFLVLFALLLRSVQRPSRPWWSANSCGPWRPLPRDSQPEDLVFSSCVRQGAFMSEAGQSDYEAVLYQDTP